MIKANEFIQAAKAQGFGLYSGVPCSYLKPFINYVIDSDDLRYVAAANEGDAVAIAAGAQLGGIRAVAMFQNSGFGNTVNPLTSLTYTFKIPILIITTLRGEPGGPTDEPQHELMGAITTDMLELMQIPWEYFPMESDAIESCLQRAVDHMDATGTPYALVMKKGSVDKWPLQSKPETKATYHCDALQQWNPQATRHELLNTVQANTRDTDVVLATTGYCGRELYACDDRANQLYMVGSMGCISSLGLGLAITQPHRRIVVLDGDGALLMRMGALTTIGYEKPNNLIHILLDNELHESTGGQSTVSHSTDFCSIAAACGYPITQRANTCNELADFLNSDNDQLRFLHIKMKPGVPDDLPRPSVTPAQVAARLQSFLKNES